VTAKAASKWPTTWKWAITVTKIGSALRTPTARRILRGCQRGNQVLIFLFEADLLLGPWAIPLRPARCRLRRENAQTKAPQTQRVGGALSLNSPPPKTAQFQLKLCSELREWLLRAMWQYESNLRTSRSSSSGQMPASNGLRSQYVERRVTSLFSIRALVKGVSASCAGVGTASNSCSRLLI
jgi:hypothetical protein